MKAIKFLFRTILILLIVAILTIGGYIAYLQTNYYRIDDCIELPVSNQRTENIEVGKDYTVMTYNIGFGAYDHVAPTARREARNRWRQTPTVPKPTSKSIVPTSAYCRKLTPHRHAVSSSTSATSSSRLSMTIAAFMAKTSTVRTYATPLTTHTEVSAQDFSH